MSAIRGWFGEKMAILGMWLSLSKKTYRRFHDVIVPGQGGTTQVDHLLVSPHGIFVIETKNMRGWIFGSADSAKWTQSIYGKKYSFQNPVRQNFRHVKCLADYLGIDIGLIYPVVFFIGECTFKTKMPPNVLRSGVAPYIRSHKEVVMSEEEVDRVADQIRKLKQDPGLNHSAHMKSLRDRHGSVSTCPSCGADLVERTAKRGKGSGSKFLGCSAYPRCRYTKNI